MPDRIYIDVHIASQKMFRLRIIGATEHLLNEDLPSACCSEQPKKAAHQQGDWQKTGPGASRLARGVHRQARENVQRPTPQCSTT
jgi:hypothetical protein